MILQRTAVHQGIVPDGYAIAYIGSSTQVGGMYYGPILYIGVVAYTNIVYIAPDDCIEPNRAVITHCNITYNSCIFSNKAIISPGRAFIFYRQNDGHLYLIYFK